MKSIKCVGILLLILLLLLCEPMNIENKHESFGASRTVVTSSFDDMLTPFVATKNIGSCKEFTGRCLFINVFLSDKESTFTEQEKQSSIDKFDSAIDYLNNQATIHNVQLTILHNRDDLEINYYTDFIISTDLTDFDFAYNLITKLKSDNNINQLIKKYDAKNFAFIFHVNKTSTSYTLQQQVGYSNVYDGEACIIYSSIYDTEKTITEIDPYVYAHEILHLFGALDLYYPDLPNDKRISLAESRFPYDVMRAYAFDLNNATLSDVDTYLFGWSKCLKKEDAVFVEQPFDKS